MLYGIVVDTNDVFDEGDYTMCEARATNGHCNHFQCPHWEETAHGVRCVNIILYGGGNGDIDNAVCDMGEDCLKKCLFSWVSSKRNTVKHKRFFVTRTPVLWAMAAK